MMTYIKKGLEKLGQALRWLARWVCTRWILPLLEKSIAFLGRVTASGPAADNRLPEEGWRQKALADFSAWLADLPAPPAEQSFQPDGCDLFSMMTEFIALRQEIRMQNREQHRTIRTQQTAATTLEEAGRLVETLSGQVEKLHVTLIDDAEQNTLLPFLDTRDALVRGIEAARRVSKQPRRWFAAPEGLESIVDGYEMALRRFDRALAQVGVMPVEAVGHPFDPRFMQAVGRETIHGKKNGTVIAEHAGGFVRAGRVLRTAQVVVNQ